MLRGHDDLVPWMVIECLALAEIERRRLSEVEKSVAWAFREHLSDEHVDRFAEVERLREAALRETRKEREEREKREPRHSARARSRALHFFMLERTPDYLRALAAVEKVLDSVRHTLGRPLLPVSRLAPLLATSIGRRAIRERSHARAPEVGSGLGPGGGASPASVPAEVRAWEVACGETPPDPDPERKERSPGVVRNFGWRRGR
jgi:hypothetical protein